jgi:hypothetical protein
MPVLLLHEEKIGFCFRVFDGFIGCLILGALSFLFTRFLFLAFVRDGTLSLLALFLFPSES